MQSRVGVALELRDDEGIPVPDVGDAQGLRQ